MKLLVDFRRITLDQLEALQSNAALQNMGKPRRFPMSLFHKKETELSALRKLLAQFLVDDNGTPIPPDEAVKKVGQLTLEEVMSSAAQISESIKEVSRTAIPPSSAGK